MRFSTASRLISAAVILSIYGAQGLHGATVNWLYPADGSWATAANWSSNPALPGTGDDVVIDQPGLIAVVLQGNQSINSLLSNENLSVRSVLSMASVSQIGGTLDLVGQPAGISGDGNVTISGQFNWVGGSMTGAGKTILSGTANTQIFGLNAATLSRALDNSGTVHLASMSSSANAILTFSNGTFNNLATGTFNYTELSNNPSGTTNFLAGGLANSFNNAGTFNFSAVPGATRNATVQFHNSGTLNVYSGTLALTGGGTNSGTINVFPSADLTLFGVNTGVVNVRTTSPSSGTNTLRISNNAVGGRINVLAGNLTIVGPGTNSGEIRVSAGASATISDLAHPASSKIAGEGSLTLNGLSEFAGTIESTGPISLNASNSFAANQNLVGPVTLGGPGTTSPVIGGSADFVSTKSFNWFTGSMSGLGKTVFGPQSVNTIALSSSNTLSRVLENAGIVNHSFTGLTFTVSSGTINNLAGATYNLIPLSSATAFSNGSGTNAFNNAGTLNVNGAGSTTTATSNIPLHNTGTLNINAGTFTLGAASTNSGTANVFAGAALNATGGITNTGTVNFYSTAAQNANTLVNAPEGQINALAGTLTVSSTGANSGKINIANGATLSITGNYTQNAGSSILGPGTLSLGTISNFSGTLGVTGRVGIGGDVTFNTPQTISGTLTLNNGTVRGNANILLTGQLNWNNGGMAGSGKTTLASGAQGTILQGSLSRVFENAGHFTFANSDTVAFSGGTFNNLESGIVYLKPFFSSTPFTNSNSNINNAGIWNFELNSSTATSLFTQPVPFNNTGTLNVNYGVLRMTGGGTNSGAINVFPGGGLLVDTVDVTNNGTLNYVNGQQSLTYPTSLINAASGQINVQGGVLTISGTSGSNSGKFNVAAGAQLAINGNIAQLAGSSINGPGGVSFSGISNFSGALNSTGNIQFNGLMTFNSDQTFAGPVFVNSGINGPGNLVAAGPFVWQPLSGGGATLGGTGKLTLKGTSVFHSSLNFQAISKVVDNAGILNWNSNNLFEFQNATFNNLAVGTINLNRQSGSSSITSFGTNALNNAGRINKVGLGTVKFGFGAAFNNSGSVNVQQGTLEISTGAHSGTFDVAAGSTLRFLLQSPSFNPGSSFTGAGTLVFASSTTLPGPNTFSGLTSISIGKLTLAHALALQYSTVEATNGDLGFGTLTSATLGNLKGARNIALANEASAAVALSVGNNSGSEIYSGALSGNGSLTKIGTGALTLSGDSTYAGTTTINAGTLLVNGNHSGGGDYLVKTGAKLGGSGATASAVTVESGGILSPGASAGILSVGSIKLNANSILDIELGGTTAGTEYDRLNSTGAAMLDGTLHVSLLNNFTPSENDVFDILNASNIAGTFAKLELPPFLTALAWNTTQLYISGEISVVETFVPGDLNRDGKTTDADIHAMLVALLDLPAYQTSRGLSEAELNMLADFDNSGAVTNADLQPLLNLVAAQTPDEGALAAVPEPASLLLAIFGAVALAAFAQQRRVRRPASI